MMMPLAYDCSYGTTVLVVVVDRFGEEYLLEGELSFNYEECY